MSLELTIQKTIAKIYQLNEMEYKGDNVWSSANTPFKCDVILRHLF